MCTPQPPDIQCGAQRQYLSFVPVKQVNSVFVCGPMQFRVSLFFCIVFFFVEKEVREKVRKDKTDSDASGGKSASEKSQPLPYGNLFYDNKA